MTAVRTKKRCLRCNHEWESTLEHPQQCPACKRKDWSGLYNSSGKRIAGYAPAPEGSLLCNQCGHVWVPRVGDPQQCPRCRRHDWYAPRCRPRDIERITCVWCGQDFQANIIDRCGRCGTNSAGLYVEGGKRPSRREIYRDVEAGRWKGVFPPMTPVDWVIDDIPSEYLEYNADGCPPWIGSGMRYEEWVLWLAEKIKAQKAIELLGW